MQRCGPPESDLAKVEIDHFISLHRAICSGKMTLVEAQAAIRTWPEAYKNLKGEK